MVVTIKKGTVPHKMRNRFLRNTGSSIVSGSSSTTEVSVDLNTIYNLERRIDRTDQTISDVADQSDAYYTELSSRLGNYVIPFGGFVSGVTIEMSSYSSVPSPADIFFDILAHRFVCKVIVAVIPLTVKYYANWPGRDEYQSMEAVRTDKNFTHISTDTVYHFDSSSQQLVNTPVAIFPYLKWNTDSNCIIVGNILPTDKLKLFRLKRRRCREYGTKNRFRGHGWGEVHSADLNHTVNPNGTVSVTVTYTFNGQELTTDLEHYHEKAMFDKDTDKPHLARLDGKCAIAVFRNGVQISPFMRFRIYCGHFSAWGV